MSDKARAELCPTGVLRAGINLSNFLLVTGRNGSGYEQRELPVDVGGDRGGNKDGRCNRWPEAAHEKYPIAPQGPEANWHQDDGC